MARDKLITIRIESEKREAFKELAKSQNTDTASLLYDFISGCLDGRIDIKLVTGKGNRLDKLDNQIDTNRLDKLETDTQEIDNKLDTITKKLNDWVIAFDDRLNDCGRELSDKIISLEHRLSTLSIQLDSQQDRQGENPDMEPLIKEALRLDFMDDQKLIDAIESQIEDTEIDESDYEDEPDTSPIPNQETVENDSTIEPDKGAIGPVRGEGNSIETEKDEAVNIEKTRQGLTNQQLSEKTRVPVSTIEKWKGKIKIGEPIVSKRYPKFFKQWRLNLTDSLWYEVD